MARLLIAGCGYVGSELARRAVDAGHEVFGLRRSEAPLPDGVHRIRADLADPASVPSLPVVDWLVVALGADARSTEAYEAAYLHAPAVLRAALPRPPARELVLSSTGVFGRDDGSDVFAHTRPEPTTGTGAVLLRAEDEAIARGAVVLRLAGIYGPGRVRLLRRVADGSAWSGPSLDRWANLVHRDDAAALSLHLVGHPAPPAVVHGVDDEPIVRRALLAELQRLIAGRPLERASAPDATLGKRVRNDALYATDYALIQPSWRAGYASVLAVDPALAAELARSFARTR